MNDLAPPPLRAVAVAPRARRRGRWIGDVLLVSLGLHLSLLALVLFAPPPVSPSSEMGLPSVEIVMGEGAKTAATTATPEPEAGLGMTAATPSDLSPPPGPVEPPTKPEPSAPPMPEQSPPAPAPSTTPAPAPAPRAPDVVRLEPPPEGPTTEVLPLPPPVPPPLPPPPLPAAPPGPRVLAAPAPGSSTLRQLSPPRLATSEPRFSRPTFSFGGGLGTPSTSGSSRNRTYADLPAGSAPLGITNPAPGIAISGDSLGPDWNSLMRAWWEQHKYYPREAAEQGQDGFVTVTIHMAPDGRVRAVEMMSRSGSQWLDMGALAIFRNQKLPPFPWNEARKEAVMNMQIQYILLR